MALEFAVPKASLRSLGGGRLVMAAIGLVPLVGIVILTVISLGMSFQDVDGHVRGGFTLEHYRRLYQDPFAYRTFLNTAVFALVSTLVALAFAVPAAWLVERTTLPGKEWVFPLMSIGLLTPGFFTAMGWVFLLHPRIGMVNRWLMDLFGLQTAPLNIATLVGMGWVQGLSLATVTFVMLAATFRNLDGALEELAQVHGLKRFHTFWRITLPLVFPGVLAAAIYVFTIALSSFEVPAIIGLGNKIFTFSTFVYFMINPEEGGLPNYGIAGATCALMVVVALFLSWWYFSVVQKTHRYAVVTGRGYRPKLVELGPKQAVLAWVFLFGYLFLSEGFPFLLVIWASLLPYFQPISLSAMQELSLDRFINLPWDVFLVGLKNTVILVALVPALLLVFCLAISWVVIRSRLKIAFIYDFIAFLPHPLPNLIFAVSAIYVALFIVPDFIPLYGTVWLLVVVYVVSKTSFGTRLFNNSLIQIHKELDEAAQVSGLSTIQVARKLLVPLLMPTMLYAWLWLALSTFRELSMAAILVTGNNLTLPVAVWGLWATGSLGAAAAASLVLVVLMTPLVVLYWRFGRRRLDEAEQRA